ncbi:MAG: thioredoxin [Deltaproteobacteria bacterium]|nr:thioredoxin [Deltaproteobacteria bacterium]MCL5793185.1 thioredoxin [Deltaproteobacteria bacterium]
MGENNMQEFTDGNFEAEVLKTEKPVLVDFWAEWCVPCRMVSPAVSALADKYNDKIKFGKLNTDENPSIPTKYGIMGIPTLMLFKGGKVVDQIVGAVPKSTIEKLLDKVL